MTRRRRRLATAACVLAPLTVIPTTATAPEAQAEMWRDQQFWLEDYGVRDAWETSRGDDVTIAVIDTGVDEDHPGLEGAVTGGTDVSGGGESSGSPVDQANTEHGTLVASLAAGRGGPPVESEDGEDFDEMSDEEWEDWYDDFIEDLEDAYGDDWEEEVDEDMLDEFYETREFPGVEDQDDDDEDDDADDDDEHEERPEDIAGRPSGVVGVAPEADLLSISLVLEDPNPNGPDTEEQIAEAVTWAVDNGADIINMSIGSGVQEWPESWDEAFLHAEQNDVLVVGASGNRAAGHYSVGAPATIPGVLTVSGVDEEGNISEESSSQGIAIDLAAASEPLVGATPDGGYALWEGTSGASPIVAGAAALIMSAYPELSAQEVKHRLLSTAESDGDDGIDPEYGHGVLNVDEAVNGDIPEFHPEDHNTLAEWIRVHRRAEPEGEDTGEEEVPEDSGVVAGPDGEPRQIPQARTLRTAQDWAAPVTLGLGGLGIVLLLIAAAAHIAARRDSTTKNRAGD